MKQPNEELLRQAKELITFVRAATVFHALIKEDEAEFLKSVDNAKRKLSDILEQLPPDTLNANLEL